MFVTVLLISCAVIGVAEATQESHPECACPSDFEPVCSTEMEMFPNQCILECYGHETTSEKAIYNNLSKRCECDCPSTYEPVCASDGSVQRNSCHLVCHGKTQSADHYYNPSLGKCEAL